MRNLCKRDISLGLIVGQNDPFATLDQLKIKLSVLFFMDIIIVMSWCIWMQRNYLIFKGILPSQAFPAFNASRTNLPKLS